MIMLSNLKNQIINTPGGGESPLLFFVPKWLDSSLYFFHTSFMSKNLKNHFIVDIEADGPCPGLYSMISFGAVHVANLNQTFYSEVKPLPGAKRIEEAALISGTTVEKHKTYNDPITEFKRFDEWVKNITNSSRATFWSDNLAFDWQFINYYFYYAGIDNPFGFSGRRIGDLYCGIEGDLYSKWKHLRDTKHTHNPVDDAVGNAQALIKIVNRLNN